MVSPATYHRAMKRFLSLAGVLVLLAVVGYLRQDDEPRPPAAPAVAPVPAAPVPAENLESDLIEESA